MVFVLVFFAAARAEVTQRSSARAGAKETIFVTAFETSRGQYYFLYHEFMLPLSTRIIEMALP